MKDRLLKIFIFLLIPALSFSQDAVDLQHCEQVTKKKAIKLYQKALDDLRTGNIRQARDRLNEAKKIEPSFAEVYFQLGLMKWEKAVKASGDYRQAANAERYFISSKKNFEKVIKYCPSTEDFMAFYYLGKFHYKRKNYTKALQYFEIFVKNSRNNGDEKKDAKVALKKMSKIAYLVKHPVPFDPHKLYDISTPKDEFLPLISPDGELAFFTRRYAKFNKETQTKRWVDEFSYSKRTTPVTSSYERFEVGQAMPAPFNQEGIDQGACSITIDNSQLYVTICKFVKVGGRPYKNCDIYVSHREKGGWSKLENLGAAINGENTWESQPSISADGKVLYFASIRPSNIGFSLDNQTIDIYVSYLKNGKWTKAKNLGPQINTSKNEKSPFIHTDSQTLYFASDGRDGMGGFDIYFSQKKNGKWTKPKNIGYPINTEGDDLGFIVSTNGQKAYFSSNKYNEDGGWDIYSFDLYEGARPKKVLFVKGKLVDESGKVITDAKVEIVNAKTNKKMEGMVDKSTGNYAVAIAAENDDDEFLVKVKKKDYAFTSKLITPKHARLYSAPVEVKMEMRPIKVGEKVRLNDVHFATNSAKLNKESLFVLDNFVGFLKENPNIKIEIHGHTDNVGNPKKNLELSQRRAKVVRDYLIFSGIKPSRIVAVRGFGQTKPIASNATAEGRAKNRRTEFVIVSK